MLLSLASSVMTGVLPSPPAAFLALSADVVELGTRLMMGLIPDVLLVLLLETLESDLVTGVGGTERWSSARVKAWSTTERRSLLRDGMVSLVGGDDGGCASARLCWDVTSAPGRWPSRDKRSRSFFSSSNLL